MRHQGTGVSVSVIVIVRVDVDVDDAVFLRKEGKRESENVN